LACMKENVSEVPSLPEQIIRTIYWRWRHIRGLVFS
jgi:hypothetical protein